MRFRYLKRKNNSGFTLVEVIVALAILALSIAVLMRMQISSAKLCGENTATLKCLAYASLEIEKINSEELISDNKNKYSNEQVDENGNYTNLSVMAVGDTKAYSTSMNFSTSTNDLDSITSSTIPVDEISLVAKYYGTEYVNFKTFKIRAF